MDETVCFSRHVHLQRSLIVLSHLAAITTAVRQLALAPCFRISSPRAHCLQHMHVSTGLPKGSRSTPARADMGQLARTRPWRQSTRQRPHQESPSSPGLRWKTLIHPHSQRKYYTNERRRPSRRSPQLTPSVTRSSPAAFARATATAGYKGSGCSRGLNH